MVISVKNLSKVYKVKKSGGNIFSLFSSQHKEVSAVKDISFDIKKGEAVAFLGPNGAGKTTTMKMLTGLIHPTAGEISVLGHTPFNRERNYLKQIGLVMGNKTGLDWDLTARQSFELLQKIYDIPQELFDKRVMDFTDMLATTNFMDTQVRKLSLGERLKMEIIGSLLHAPSVLFLDEPTIGLDVISKQKIREFLRMIQKETQVTLLLTSHDMDDIEKVCDRVIVINHGLKVYDDSLLKLTNHYKKDRYLKLIFENLPEKSDIEKLGEVVEENEVSYTLKVSQQKVSQLLSKVTSSYELNDIDILSVPLDEIIADLFKKTN